MPPPAKSARRTGLERDAPNPYELVGALRGRLGHALQAQLVPAALVPVLDALYGVPPGLQH